MKNKLRIFALVLALLMLCGCQLAREDLEAGGADRDRMIGVFVTLEHLDLFDDEAYLEDNINAILAGKDLSQVDTSKYGGRLYATLVDRVLTNEETGETVTTKEYVFDTVEGFAYMVPMMEEVDGAYIGTSSDEGISHGHTAIKSGETEEYALTGTIYLSPGYDDGVCYLNPVYQSADGSVYTVQGSGYFMSGAQAEGTHMTTTLSEESTVTIDGEKKATKTTVSISVAVMFAPTQIIVTEMNDADEIVARNEYAPGEMPKTLTPQADTAYVVVHTEKRDYEGNDVRTTELYDTSDDGFDTYFCRDDGVCVAWYTDLAWDS